MKKDISMNNIRSAAAVTAEYFDMCILCGEDTKVLKITPIYLRPFYVETAGQLCRKCWKSIYK